MNKIDQTWITHLHALSFILTIPQKALMIGYNSLVSYRILVFYFVVKILNIVVWFLPCHHASKRIICLAAFFFLCLTPHLTRRI
jgi:hypothetical protein